MKKFKIKKAKMIKLAWALLCLLVLVTTLLSLVRYSF